MKRIGTALFSFIILSIFAFHSEAQTLAKHSNPVAPSKTNISVAGPFQAGVPSGPESYSSESPLATKTDTVSYFQDTTGGNWWGYVPILDQASGDSLGYYGVNTDGTLYFQNEDTIGGTEFKYINSSGVTIDTTPFDTMYYRMMALRVSTPTDLKGTIKLVGASLTFLPISFHAADHIEVWVVPMQDVPFLDGNTYPIPNIFATNALIKTSIPSDSIVAGQINTVYIPINKTLTSAVKTQLGICLFVDGPSFQTDTVAYIMDQNLQSAATNISIDTDGSLGVTGESMRTYKLSLDGGHMMIEGQSNYVGGGGGFFVNFGQIDPTSGQQTGSAFDGNLVLNAYYSGTAAAVNENGTVPNELEGNYPNPVSTTSEIRYHLAQSGPVSIQVFNQLGEVVGTVVNGIQGAGGHTATFNAGMLTNGMYYYKLQSGDFTSTRTMVISR